MKRTLVLEQWDEGRRDARSFCRQADYTERVIAALYVSSELEQCPQDTARWWYLRGTLEVMKDWDEDMECLEPTP
jgi:hypothetical protein